MKKTKAGFTLIEIVIVLGIIGIIITLSVVSLNSIRQNSRDAVRISDIKQIQSALELYRANIGHYPAAITSGQALSSTSTTYMNIIPSNPNPTNSDICSSTDYIYTSNSYSYTLGFCLEKSSGAFNPGSHCATPVGIKNGTCN